MTPQLWPVVAYDEEPGYRYVREARNEQLPDKLAVIIGKNPSTANDERNDPTVRHVEAWAEQAGFGRLCIVNLFALRSPKPSDLEFGPHGEVPLAHAVGARNDEVLVREAQRGGTVVAAWGGDKELTLRGRYRARIAEVLDLLSQVPLHTMGGVSSDGFPVHGYCWHGLRRGRELQPADLRRLDPRIARPVPPRDRPRRGTARSST